ncbi:hypothetical protein GBA63_21025 [Rubrobacter tropicus]|uniref:DUF7452 domain-containing protein n=1 Tax=Rubrobacter tropicus TaxID=2653851 RepID=A0A6G8QEH9_9ACTN|nr:hypothetical protein [Rubrobacter tropicus]QIN84848.1 hypothetical protein GBA63_21025 [Rubrobacter tropicus]
MGAYAKRAALVLVIAILAVDVFLAFRFYGNIKTAEGGLDVPRATTIAEPENTAPRSAEPTEIRAKESDPNKEAAFLHRATAGNTVANSTYFDHPMTTGKPGAFVIAEGPSDYEREIGVWYDGSRGRWAVFNQDRSPMPEGTAFRVVVSEGKNGIVHRAKPGNIVENGTFLDDPLTNEKPGVELAVTQNWNPGGVGNTYNDHPVGVRYDDDRDRWEVFNEDRAPMPPGAAFNVSLTRTP